MWGCIKKKEKKCWNDWETQGKESLEIFGAIIWEGKLERDMESWH